MFTLLWDLASKAAAPFLAVSVLYLWWTNGQLDADLREERLAHQQTAARLETALDRAAQWQVAAEFAEKKLPPLQEALQTCWTRERQAATDAAERSAILDAARPEPRTPQERQEVVDEATRRKAMDRLNRAL